jgi:two-component system sensor histidine kinase HydH
VYVNLYAGPTARADQLVLTTYGAGPLPGPVANSALKFGALHWLISVSPKDSLIGGAAAAAPWLILGLLLLMALLLGGFVEVLVRRQRYARQLVEERTAELVETQRTLVRQERLAAIGEMASVVSHELRNPLSAVINDLFLVRRRAEPELGADSERHLGNAEREVYRAARLSEDLLAYARERDPQLAEVDLDALVAEVLETTPVPPDVTLSVDAPVRFQADPALMAQVLANVITNAFQAMPDGGPLQLSAQRVDGMTEIVVHDSGSGIDPEVADRLFDPFFTTKDGGTGLGLAIVHRLVEAHGGQVSIENDSGGGARVSIRIPGPGSAS